jgi:hypothetical protein
MGHSYRVFGTKAYCVRTSSKVNGHLVKKFTSDFAARGQLGNEQIPTRKTRPDFPFRGSEIAVSDARVAAVVPDLRALGTLFHPQELSKTNH